MTLVAQYFLNHDLDTDEVKRHVRWLAEAGYQAVCPQPRHGLMIPFFSEEWWRVIEAMISACQETGMKIWLWDEDGYPSGVAGGRIVGKEPGLAARGLVFSVITVHGDGPFDVDFPTGFLLRAFAYPMQSERISGEGYDITTSCGTRRSKWTGRKMKHAGYSPGTDSVANPEWRCKFVENRFALRWRPPQPGTYQIVGVLASDPSTIFSNLLQPEGIRSFIDQCHETYYRRYHAEYGKLIQGIFTDEPKPGPWLYPWSECFCEKFKADHGYDLMPLLGHLAVDVDERSVMVRHHYRLTQHRLQKRNYFEQISGWCRSRQIQFSGHLPRTEWLSLAAAWWPNELRCYEPMDIPACDPLGAGCGWPDAASYHTGIKVVSSAAHLFGKEQVSSDALAVIGDEAGIRDLKYLCDYQMVLGVNHFFIHGLNYSIDGPRKDEAPPSLFYQHTQWKYMKVLLDYLKQTCGILTGGTHVCQIGLLYPATSLACQMNTKTDWQSIPDEPKIHQCTELLLSHHRDFDWIDELTLAQQMDSLGNLKTPESYSVIILPYLKYIDQRTAEALLRFAEQGGRVVTIGGVPHAISNTLENALMTWDTSIVEQVGAITPKFLSTLPGVTVKGKNDQDIFVLHRQNEGKNLWMVFNRNEREFRGEVEGQQVIVSARGSVLLTDEPNHPNAATDFTKYEKSQDISSNWMIQFEPNHIPLNFWHVDISGSGLPRRVFTSLPTIDLMQRQEIDADSSTKKIYYYRFMLTGRIDDAALVIEDSAIRGEGKIFVNDHPVEEWEKTTVYDCRNKRTAISPFLLSGSTPTLNVIRIETTGDNNGLEEVPYLYGTFTCQYRYGHLSFPFLQAAEPVRNIPLPCPWSALGYPTFSGTAIYTRTVNISSSGNYILDLGDVEDCVSVSIDGNSPLVLAWPPYRCLWQGLTPRRHQIKLEVSNAPANRNRAAGLVAGVLGPIRLIQTLEKK